MPSECDSPCWTWTWMTNLAVLCEAGASVFIGKETSGQEDKLTGTDTFILECIPVQADTRISTGHAQMIGAREMKQRTRKILFGK